MNMKTSLLSIIGLLSVLTVTDMAKATTVCDEDTLARTVTGTAAGAIFGAIVSEGSSRGAAIGAMFGGAIGLGLSCTEYPDYYRERNLVLDDEIGNNYHEWRNGRIRVIRTGYYDDVVCRQYESYFAARDEYGEMREHVVTETACRYENGWHVVDYPETYYHWSAFYPAPVYIPSVTYVWGYGYYRQYGHFRYEARPYAYRNREVYRRPEMRRGERREERRTVPAHRAEPRPAPHSAPGPVPTTRPAPSRPLPHSPIPSNPGRRGSHRIME